LAPSGIGSFASSQFPIHLDQPVTSQRGYGQTVVGGR
jgi:hypothetical protein